MSRKEMITIGLSIVATGIAVGSILYAAGKEDSRSERLEEEVKSLRQELSASGEALSKDVLTLQRAFYALREILLKNGIQWEPGELPSPMMIDRSGFPEDEEIIPPLDIRVDPLKLPTKVLQPVRP